MTTRKTVTPEKFAQQLCNELDQMGSWSGEAPSVLYLKSLRNEFAAIGSDVPFLICREADYKSVMAAFRKLSDRAFADPPFLGIHFWPQKVG